MPGSKDDDQKSPRRPRVPEELAHRLAHDAAARAAGKFAGKISWAYETMYWDDVAKLALASLVGVKKGSKFLDPDDAAEMAAEYADALLAERRKRVRSSERGAR